MVTSRKLLYSQTQIPGSKVQYNKRHLMTQLNFFYLDLRSRSRLKVKGHRHGGVCVLWMLLVFLLFFSQARIYSYDGKIAHAKHTLCISWLFAALAIGFGIIFIAVFVFSYYMTFFYIYWRNKMTKTKPTWWKSVESSIKVSVFFYYFFYTPKKTRSTGWSRDPSGNSEISKNMSRTTKWLWTGTAWF